MDESIINGTLATGAAKFCGESTGGKRVPSLVSAIERDIRKWPAFQAICDPLDLSMMT